MYVCVWMYVLYVGMYLMHVTYVCILCMYVYTYVCNVCMYLHVFTCMYVHVCVATVE